MLPLVVLALGAALQPPPPPCAAFCNSPAYAPAGDTARLRSGQLAPGFALLDDAGKSVSLSAFRGKVVYLDFWGTWCRPCLRDMTEFAPALKKQFEGRDVVFLYVSVGDTETKWKQVLAEQHLTGPGTVHLRSISTNQARDYEVDGYPSCYLIGRDGRLIQAHAPRPSTCEKIVAALESALKQ